MSIKYNSTKLIHSWSRIKNTCVLVYKLKLVTKMRKSGSNTWSACPRHADITPTFPAANVLSQRWKHSGQLHVHCDIGRDWKDCLKPRFCFTNIFDFTYFISCLQDVKNWHPKLFLKFVLSLLLIRRFFSEILSLFERCVSHSKSVWIFHINEHQKDCHSEPNTVVNGRQGEKTMKVIGHADSMAAAALCNIWVSNDARQI